MLAKNKYLRNKNHFKKYWNGVPATVKKSLFEMHLYESIFASIFWHTIGLLLICLIVFCFNFFGITPKLFPKPQKPIQDIEFIIKNSSSSGRIKAPKALPKSSIPEAIIDIDKDILPVKNNLKTNRKTNENKKHVSWKKTGSKIAISDFSIPMPNLKSMSSGLGNSRGNKLHAGSAETSNSSISGIDNAFSAGGSSSAGKGSSGNTGFDKNAARKIIATYDISPYVNELKRDIQWNWKVPKGYENKKVELFLRIAKDGKLIILNVKRTSEVGEVDNAALNAVKKCVPLNPLPSKYSKSYLDIIFTFAFNSIRSRY